MADREQPYDPYIPSGGAGQQGAQGQNGNMRTAALQAVRYHHICATCRVNVRQSRRCRESRRCSRGAGASLGLVDA